MYTVNMRVWCVWCVCVCTGVDSIVSLHIHEDEHIRNLSVKVVEYIGDITPAEVSCLPHL